MYLHTGLIRRKAETEKDAPVPNDAVYVTKGVDCWTIAGVVVVLKMDRCKGKTRIERTREYSTAGRQIWAYLSHRNFTIHEPFFLSHGRILPLVFLLTY